MANVPDLQSYEVTAAKLATLAFVAALLGTQAASASTLSYDCARPTFTEVNGSAYSTADRITGSISFDDSALTNGSDRIDLRSGDSNPAQLLWAFTDGHVSFDQNGTSWGWQMTFDLVDYKITSWYLDTTYGWTSQDIFSYGSVAGSTFDWGNSNDDSGYATVSTADAGAWNFWNAAGASTVPEPTSLALVGLALLAGGAVSRRKAV